MFFQRRLVDRENLAGSRPSASLRCRQKIVEMFRMRVS